MHRETNQDCVQDQLITSDTRIQGLWMQGSGKFLSYITLLPQQQTSTSHKRGPVLFRKALINCHWLAGAVTPPPPWGSGWSCSGSLKRQIEHGTVSTPGYVFSPWFQKTFNCIFWDYLSFTLCICSMYLALNLTLPGFQHSCPLFGPLLAYGFVIRPLVSLI